MIQNSVFTVLKTKIFQDFGWKLKNQLFTKFETRPEKRVELTYLHVQIDVEEREKSINAASKKV